MRNHDCGDERKISGVPIWLPSPPPACIEIIDDDSCQDDWRDEWICRPVRRRSRRLRRPCRPFCPPPCPQPCPPPGPPPCQPSFPSPFPVPCWPLERTLEFCVCVGSVWEITCVEVEVECVRLFQRERQSCLWLELCVTLQYRDRFCNNYTHKQRVSVECCDIPLPGPCSCCPPRVEVCGIPCAALLEGRVCITAPIRIC